MIWPELWGFGEFVHGMQIEEEEVGDRIESIA